MSVTLETSQPLRSLSKLLQAALQSGLVERVCRRISEQKRYDISLIRETSHASIAPYVADAPVGSAHHASRAMRSSARSFITPGGIDGGVDGSGGDGGVGGGDGGGDR